MEKGSHKYDFLQNGNRTNRKLEITQPKREKKYSFLEYLAGGTQISLSVGIDFTASNGNPREYMSLHRFTHIPISTSISHTEMVNYLLENFAQMNSYQQAILSVGSILLSYDQDKAVSI